MTTRDRCGAKARDLRNAADLLRMLAHPTRLAILRELSIAPKCVTDIKDLVDVGQANVSQHLSALRGEEIVDYHEDGKMRCYYISRPHLVRRLLSFIDGDYPTVWRSPEAVKRAGRRRNETCPTSSNGSRTAKSRAST